MDKRATIWAHLPRDVAFDRAITHGAARLLACLHTLAIEQNPQAPVTDPMKPEELRALVRLFGKSQFYKLMKDLEGYALIEIVKLPGVIWRVRPLSFLSPLFSGKPENSGKPVYDDSISYKDSLKDSESLSTKVLKYYRHSPENRKIPENRKKFRDVADPEILEGLRSVGVGGNMRSLIALSPHASIEYVAAYVRAIEVKALPLRLAIAKMRDGDPPPEICEECHRIDGRHDLDCVTARKKYVKGWLDD